MGRVLDGHLITVLQLQLEELGTHVQEDERSSLHIGHLFGTIFVHVPAATTPRRAPDTLDEDCRMVHIHQSQRPRTIPNPVVAPTIPQVLQL